MRISLCKSQHCNEFRNEYGYTILAIASQNYSQCLCACLYWLTVRFTIILVNIYAMILNCAGTIDITTVYAAMYIENTLARKINTEVN